MLIVIASSMSYDPMCYLYNETSQSPVLCNDLESGRIEFTNATNNARSIVEEWNYTCEDAEFFWIFRYQDLGKTFYVLGRLGLEIASILWPAMNELYNIIDCS